jgi:hypothetical protein
MPQGEVVVYEAPDGSARVEVVIGDETVWLTQAQMVELFGRGQSVVARHIQNVFREGELAREGSLQILQRTLDRGRPTTLYNQRPVFRRLGRATPGGRAGGRAGDAASGRRLGPRPGATPGGRTEDAASGRSGGHGDLQVIRRAYVRRVGGRRYGQRQGLAAGRVDGRRCGSAGASGPFRAPRPDGSVELRTAGAAGQSGRRGQSDVTS